MLSKSEIEMLAYSTPDELVAHIRTLTPRVREAQHTLKLASRDFERLNCMLSAARSILLTRRTERRNHSRTKKTG